MMVVQELQVVMRRTNAISPIGGGGGGGEDISCTCDAAQDIQTT